MTTNTSQIETLFNSINKALFRIDGELDYSEVTQALIQLSELILETETDESLWCLGECGDCCLDDLIIGAYWHYSEWHEGQASQTYLALCWLGRIYSPNMDSGDNDNAAYMALEEMAS